MKVLPQNMTPYIETNKRPEEIIGLYYELYIKHWRAWQKCEGSESYLSKAFSEDERKVLGEINEELLYNGYRVDTITDAGEIKWLVVTQSIRPEIRQDERRIPPDKMIDDIGEEMPKGELG